MRIPMKVDYGVRALVELSLHWGEGPMQTAEIATRQGIPEPYLDQVLSTLQRFGFIRSRRGPQGGHVLAKSAHDITLGMVMASLDGASAPLDCIEEPTECTLSSTCAQREVWRSVEETVQSLLSSTTVGELALRQKRLAGRGMYQI